MTRRRITVVGGKGGRDANTDASRVNAGLVTSPQCYSRVTGRVSHCTVAPPSPCCSQGPDGESLPLFLTLPHFVHIQSLYVMRQPAASLRHRSRAVLLPDHT